MNEKNTIHLDFGFIPHEKIDELFTEKFKKLQLTLLVIIAENKKIKDVNELTCNLKKLCRGKRFHIVFTSIVNLLSEILSSDEMVKALKVLDEFQDEDYKSYIR